VSASSPEILQSAAKDHDFFATGTGMPGIFTLTEPKVRQPDLGVFQWTGWV